MIERISEKGFTGVYRTHTHALIAIYENLKDRDAARLSFFMLCAVCVQIEYYNMEIIDIMDIFITRSGTTETQYYHIDTVEIESSDLKSPGGNTVWVRPPPALPDVEIYGGKPLKLGHSAHRKECAVVFNQIETQGTLTNSLIDDYLLTWLEAFLIDRKARGLADGTLRFYRIKLKLFTDFCETQVVTQIGQITPTLLRQYLLHLEETGHNEGGRHAAYRTIRAFLYWYEDEVEPEGWRNPIRKVRAPKVPTEPIDPVPIDVVAQMVKICERGTFTGDRDAAILLCLLDTGARAGEFLAIDLEDINQARGDILIRQGKGGKPRTVYIGKQSKRAIRRYLKHRNDNNQALWVTHPRFGFERLGYDGLRAVLTRRASLAKVVEPSLHDFRRAFCLAMLREGTDIFTLAKLMGHESTAVLQRYLKQTNQDTEQAHRRAGPVDNVGL